MKNKTPIAELSRMTASELRKELQMKRAELAKMRMGLAMQSEKNHALYKRHKKDVARMSMVLVQLLKKAPPAPAAVAEAPAKEKAKKVSKEKPSQAKKKSVKDTGSKSKKS